MTLKCKGYTILKLKYKMLILIWLTSMLQLEYFWFRHFLSSSIYYLELNNLAGNQTSKNKFKTV